MSKFKFECKLGSLEAFDDYLILSRNQLLIIKSTAVSQKIMYKDITSIQFKNCGWTQGIIDFDYAGSIDGKFIFGASTIGKAKKLAKEMESIHEYIEKRVDEIRNSPSIGINSSISIADEIKKFKQLMDDGIISEDEFNAKKKDMLNL